MSINWELYDLLERFWLVEAACLWLEIEPTTQIKENPPHEVIRIMSFMEEKLYVYRAGWAAPSKLIKTDGHPLPVETCRVRHGINYSLEEARNQIPLVFKSDLLKLAQELGKKPKFLFQEAREQDDEGWKKGKIGKRSYQKLIKVLCHFEGKIDLEDINVVSKIKALAERTGNNISDPIIRGILDEVDPSRLNRSNRRTGKTK